MLTNDKTKRARSSNSFIPVIISWLERRDIFQTFEDDSQRSDKDIKEIRQLLDHEESESKINLQD